MLSIDEAWLPFIASRFSGEREIREWLKVMRKANCAVILATQSLSDAVRSGLLDVLVESCPTKIYLPNLSALQEAQVEMYRSLGLNMRQIEIIAKATPKTGILRGFSRRPQKNQSGPRAGGAVVRGRVRQGRPCPDQGAAGRA